MIVGYINGQSLEIHHSKVVADTVDYLTADFVFQTNEWLGFRKWVHFKKGEEHYQIMLSNDKVTKKDHLNLSQGEWEVYIHGSLGNEIITTNKSILNVEATGELDGLPAEEKPIPPQDLILNLIGDLQNLNTETKENLVLAINEVLSKIGSGGGGSGGKGIVNIYTSSQDLPVEGESTNVTVTVNYTDGTQDGFSFTVPPGAPGKNGKDGAPGKDYVLTEADKTEIAEQAVEIIDTALLGLIG